MDILKQIQKNIHHLELQISMQKTEIARMTSAGTSSGKPYWRKANGPKAKDVLYILYPMRNGKRRKEYVGTQQYAIDEAMAKMQRYKDRQAIVDHMLNNQALLAEVDRDIQEISDKLTGKKRQKSHIGFSDSLSV